MVNIADENHHVDCLGQCGVRCTDDKVVLDSYFFPGCSIAVGGLTLPEPRP